MCRIILFMALLTMIVPFGFSLTECGNITSSGEYVLDNNVESAINCINIQVGNVSLDCQGYTITFGNETVGYGIYVYNGDTTDNVTIRNCNVVKSNLISPAGDRGIFLNTVNNNLVTDNNVTINNGSSNLGIYAAFSSNSIINNSKIDMFDDFSNMGIQLAYVSGMNITNNEINMNGSSSNIGIELYGLSEPNLIQSNTININSSSYDYGIYVYSSTEQIIDNNTIDMNVSLTENYGIYTYAATANSFTDNAITIASGDDAYNNNGLYLILSEYNNITSGSVNITSTLANYGIYIDTSNYNNISSVALSISGQGASIYLRSLTNLFLSNQNVPIVNSSVIINNTDAAIAWKEELNITESENIVDVITISPSFVSVNISLMPSLNKTSEVTFFGLSSSLPLLYYNSQICPEDRCIVLDPLSGLIIGGIFRFQVTGWSQYESSTGNVTCNITPSNQTTMYSTNVTYIASIFNNASNTNTYNLSAISWSIAPNVMILNQSQITLSPFGIGNVTLLIGDTYSGIFNVSVRAIHNETTEANATSEQSVTYSMFNISFVNPTPVNATNSTSNNHIVNVSLLGVNNLSDMRFNWNGTETSAYNSSLMLLMNFDNISALGESDSIAKDMSIYNRTGSISPTYIKYTNGLFRKALNFSFPDYYDNEMVSVSPVPPAFTALTIEAWINIPSLPALESVLIMQGGNIHNFKFSIENSDLRFTSGQSSPSNYTISESTSGYNVPLDTWTHIAITYNGTSGTFYKNGNVFSSFSDSDGLRDVSNSLTIGEHPSVLYTLSFNGTMDEMRLYNISLSAAEIQQHYKMNLNKYDAGKWNLFVNKSSLADGIYNYNATATDWAGNVNSTETRSLEIDHVLSECRTVAKSGSYVMESNLTSDSTCFNFNISNITLDCQGYTITYGNTTAGYGVNITGSGSLTNVTVKNCRIAKGAGGGNYNYGIYAQSTSNSTIQNNTISTNGASDNYGIYLNSSSSNNNLSSNNISTNGTSYNHGIYLLSSSSNNLSSNNISTNGTLGSIGIQIRYSNSISIVSNSIVTNGNTVGYDYGISLTDSSNGCVVTLNNITAGKSNNGNENHGIYLGYSSNHNITDNKIVANGSWTSTGIAFVGSNLNLISGNNISANNYISLWLYTGAVSNTFSNNILNGSGTAINAGANSFGNNFTNNTILGNPVYGVLLGGLGANTLNQTFNLSYLTGTYPLAMNTGTTLLSYTQPINLTNTTNLYDVVSLPANLSKVNITAAPDLNKTANIYLYNLPFAAPLILRDATDSGAYSTCPTSICTFVSYGSGTLMFNVTGWSSYVASEGSVSVIASPTSQIAGLNQNKTYNVTIFNNASNSQIYNLSISNLTAAPNVMSLNQSQITIAGLSNGTATLTLGSSSDGIFNVTVSAILSTNSTINGTSNQAVLTIDTTPPTGNITLASANGFQAGGSINVTFNISDNVGIGNITIYTFYPNTSSWQNLSCSNNCTIQFNTTSNQTVGNYTVNATMYDSSSNSANYTNWFGFGRINSVHGGIFTGVNFTNATNAWGNVTALINNSVSTMNIYTSINYTLEGYLINQSKSESYNLSANFTNFDFIQVLNSTNGTLSFTTTGNDTANWTSQNFSNTNPSANSSLTGLIHTRINNSLLWTINQDCPAGSICASESDYYYRYGLQVRNMSSNVHFYAYIKSNLMNVQQFDPATKHLRYWRCIGTTNFSASPPGCTQWSGAVDVSDSNNGINLPSNLTVNCVVGLCDSFTYRGNFSDELLRISIEAGGMTSQAPTGGGGGGGGGGGWFPPPAASVEEPKQAVIPELEIGGSAIARLSLFIITAGTGYIIFKAKERSSKRKKKDMLSDLGI